MDSIEQIPDLADRASVFRIEAALRASRYAALITDSLQAAVGLLSDRERMILPLRYERQLRVCDVARMFGIKPPSMTKQIDKARFKLHRGVVTILATKHRLAPSGIDECLTSILEDHKYTLPSLI